MATQREWEAVVWHFLADKLRDTHPNEIKRWIYGFEPDTEAQEKRWNNAIAKVKGQVQRFADEETCEEECITRGHDRV